MARGLSPDQLDEILALQLVLAWAGESPGGEHPRLGWWKTDLIDLDGGGDLWRRLLPRTQRWAGLDAARRAALRVDERLRRENARADIMLTLFHFGFELDEALDERLAHHKLEAHPPVEVLPLLQVIDAPLNRAELLSRLSSPGLDLSFKKVTPEGRQLKPHDGEGAVFQARRFAAVMLTEPPATYPLPFILSEANLAGR
ncbi:BREX-6 system BrxE protein [Pyxidicoccus fallax]|uniref:BREX-6 system BrxE protein n=1 Tax=Pyxidicoccus fallax TaxID=394095 RepID=A0A848LP31_9BACT|nr:BREX-6 system BrxE protein [Pyxidicoccus fallax]NMO19429.1 BREX-6 system BrxE protein [Pyxidicoccus fallax]NPC81567.1 BREX-6 system BrxE protein [Pyxidicoccus fallax]